MQLRRRIAASVLAGAVAMTTIFGSGAPIASAASKKAVKSVTLKIGSKKVTKKTVKVTKGKKVTIKAVVNPAKAKKSVKFTSSKKSVATVSSKGKVTAKKAGTTKITVTVKGKNNKKKTAWVKIKVNNPSKPTVTQKPTVTTPVVTEMKMIGANSAIDDDRQIAVTMQNGSSVKLAGSEIILTGQSTGITVKAAFTKFEGDKAYYQISEADFTNKLCPGDGSSNDNYAISSSIAYETGLVVAYHETISKTRIEGFVYTENDFNKTGNLTANNFVPIKGATVTDTLTNKSVKTKADGSYSIASDAGSHTLVVTYDGYFKQSAKGITVNNSAVTTKNFEMKLYEEDSLYIAGTVKNADANAGQKVKGAIVTLWEKAEGSTTWTTKASVAVQDAGTYVFGNIESSQYVSKHDLYKSATKRYFGYYDGITPNNSYKITVDKGLTASNREDVFEPSGDIAVALNESNYLTEVNVELTPAAKVESIEASVSWEAGVAVADGDKVTLDIAVLTKNNLVVATKSYTTSTLKDLKADSFDLVTQLFASKAPALPNDTYYVRMSDGKDAISVTAFAVSNGKADKVDAVIKKSAKKCIINNKLASQETTISLAAAKKIDYEILDTNGIVVLSKKDVSILNKDIVSLENLEADKEYTIVPVTDYYNVDTENTASMKITPSADSDTISRDVSYFSAGVLSKLTLTQLQDYAGKDVSTALEAPIKSITLEPVTSSCKEASYTWDIKSADYDTPTVGEIKSGVNLTTTLVSGSPYVLTNIYPGEYKMTVVLDGYDATTLTESIKIDSFKNNVVTNATTFRKIPNTTVYGQCTVKDTAGDTSVAKNAIVMLINEKKRVVAASYVGANGTYNLEDSITGNFGKGTYTMVIRGLDFEVYTQEVQISASDVKARKEINVALTGHNGGKYELDIFSGSNAALSTDALVTATDEYFVYPIDFYCEPDAQNAIYQALEINEEIGGFYLLKNAGNNTYTTSQTLSNTVEYDLVVTASNIETYDNVLPKLGGQDKTKSARIECVSYNADRKDLSITIADRNTNSDTLDFIQVIDNTTNKVVVIYTVDKTGTTAASYTDVVKLPTSLQGYTVEAFVDGDHVGTADAGTLETDKKITINMELAK